MEYDTAAFENLAADEAYTKFMDGYYVRDDDAKWRFFTGTRRLRMYRGRGEEWGLKREFSPIADAAVVAAYLQREFDGLRFL